MAGMLQSFAAIATLLFVALLRSADAEAQPQGTQIGSDVVVERVSVIDTRELWHLGVPQHVISRIGKPPGGVIGLWQYDSESGLRNEGWITICLIMDGFGDLAETPVALRVWSKSPTVATINEQPPGANRAVSFAITVNEERFFLSHTADGRVFLNDELVGEIR
jgi:hypothetical protein